ncbi:NADH dehydrogenase [ubiquinone] 1 beta subcomplex subunit 8, mitochondrial [Strongylocentrotus purpuratus]|uniref:NADH dehydrogenase [ubiquinone] 1 beta subcomplex subunit 8, mitochondrial n=1 Tax=Strongylocentrotus purpuratus TaxID=7668 RepID=A0A7M7RIJ0_STRPU|nr:NADH dehydrogenase [ubiquinone] 1 beta subcomplex subunit 8, mitochondrial [Strongylocentrotus purpuratus]|eukprot:XP_796479.1 PREDICTED: NADH dehydrogenase [ubiquinone] 1 beta subcomplex subunit 8, mitochondrial [Strongylocentrotus purpuratus]
MALARCARCLRFDRFSPVVRVSSARYASGDVSLPGPYPETPEERAAAAKKYGMRVEDYEPYADDGWGWGDYPKLKKQHADDRDPHGDWDFPEDRRNWGEVMHIEQDLFVRQRPNAYKQNRKIPLWKQSMILGGILTTLATLGILGNKYKYFVPVGPKQYPFNNLYVEKGGDPDAVPDTPKNYTFPTSSYI